MVEQQISKMTDVKYISADDKLMAIHLPASYSTLGIEFFTPNNFSQQMGFMSYKEGKVIQAHYHKPVLREVVHTNEALFVRKGRIRVDFYDDNNDYLFSEIIGAGDVLLLISGGHGFEVLEECEMVEIKQGPYAGDQDKTLIANVDRRRVNEKNADDPSQ
jgi:hypothetical protein